MTEETVLITGANSCIGLEITKLLNYNSKKVIAGVRKKETFSIFDNMDHAVPVLLDVTKTEIIKSNIDYIHDNGYIIKGLVNNAGISNSLSLMIILRLKICKICLMCTYSVFIE